jgi:membrane protease YdiL (CAAX protease family)
MRQMVKPRWGLLEIVAVYIGIITAGFLFSRCAGMLKTWLNGTGIEDKALAFFTIAYIYQFVITILLVLLFTLVLNRARLSDLGVRNVQGRDYLYYGLLGGFLLLIFIISLGLIINLIHPDIEPQLFEEILRSTSGPGGFVILFIMGAVLAPISEELYYRGMIYPVFRGYLGPFWGAILAGIIFGLVHWDLWRAIPLAAGGVVLCYIYEKSGSILVSALAHGLWNGIMALIIYFSVIRV